MKKSIKGYKRNSPDKNEKQLLIPSGNITMKDVDFPLIGVDNLGNMQYMLPGQDYAFPGDYVIETPMFQKGGSIKRDPILVYDKNDSRLLAYNDSLNVFNKAEKNWMYAQNFGRKNSYGEVYYPTQMVNDIPNVVSIETNLEPLAYHSTVDENRKFNRDFPVYKKPEQPVKLVENRKSTEIAKLKSKEGLFDNTQADIINPQQVELNNKYKKTYHKDPANIREFGPQGKFMNYAEQDASGNYRPLESEPKDLYTMKKMQKGGDIFVPMVFKSGGEPSERMSKFLGIINGNTKKVFNKTIKAQYGLEINSINDTFNNQVGNMPTNKYNGRSVIPPQYDSYGNPMEMNYEQIFPTQDDILQYMTKMSMQPDQPVAGEAPENPIGYVDPGMSWETMSKAVGDKRLTDPLTPDNNTYTKNNSIFDPMGGFIGSQFRVAGAKTLTRLLNQGPENKRWDKFFTGLTLSDNLFDSEKAVRGDYSVNTGNFRVDRKTPTQFTGKGLTDFGSFKKGGEYKTGGEYELSQEEIDYIINNGGSVEYLD